MNEHRGHRQRMRRRFLAHGLESFDDHNVLELLLFYALPRVDTNELAHLLLERFGSLGAVLDASPEELTAVEGLGENAVALLKLIPATSERYLSSKNSIGSILATTEAAGAFLLPRFMNRRDECVMLVCLDAKMKAVGCHVIASGDVTTAHVSVRKVVERSLSSNAPFVILAHNHVGGLALPSVEDVSATRRMQQALAVVGVTLLDHIVVAGDDFVSIRDSGLMQETDAE